MKKIYFKGLVTKTAEGKYKVLASTATIDRMGDSIDQSGWELENFKNNPVMPWAHDYSELPVAKATSVEVTEQGLELEFEFAPAEGNPKAQQIKVLYDEGYLNAVSVGFIPKQRNGNVITQAELLEVSFVPVPANQEALRLAVKNLESGKFDEAGELKGAIEFMVKSIKEVSEKGEVADELDAEEKWEQKYEKWNEVCEVLGALWTVYFDEATPVEDFSKLLNEAIALLQTVSENNGADDDDTGNGQVQSAMKLDNQKAFIEFLTKSGRTLSKKTLENIDNAISSMKSATTVLEQLKADSSADEQDGKSAVSAEKETKENESDVLALSDGDMKIIRRTLINGSKDIELSLSIVNAFLKEKGIKV